GDPAELRRVLVNLITNASEALGDHGTIVVSTGVMDADAAYLKESQAEGDTPPGRYVWFEVADDGCGMSEQAKSVIFDPFAGTKFAGRGLGLAAALGTVRSHRGGIHVESWPGRGSVFRVLLPPSAGVAAPPRRVEAPRAALGDDSWIPEGGAVLVVDDQEAVRSVTQAMLRRCGFDVMTASDGVEAIALYRKAHAQIAAVLVDMTMPGLDGVEVVKRLRLIRPDVRAVLMSGYTEDDIARRIGERAFADFLHKPFTSAALRDKLRSVLGRPVSREGFGVA
ncbi:MAG TPA: response regulator, partial [Planctomycetota bacterium]|nr:response regulator [Planctomycetota bacterium]